MNNEIKKMKEDFLLNLEKEDLESYIDNLIKEYYNYFLASDKESLKTSIIDLMRLPSLFEDKYPNMNNYINYRLVVVSNKIFESIFSNRGDLYYPLEHIQMDYIPQENDLSDLFDDGKIRKILFESQMKHIHEFMDFVKFLPNIKSLGNPKKKLPRVLVDEVCDFMEGIKSGAYDGYFDIPEEIIVDENPYDNLNGDSKCMN